MEQQENRAQRLTDAQIEQGWRDTFSTNNPFCPCDLKTFTKAARWAEANVHRQRVNEREVLVSLLQQWAALDAGSWHAVRHENEKARLLDDTRAALANVSASAA